MSPLLVLHVEVNDATDQRQAQQYREKDLPERDRRLASDFSGLAVHQEPPRLATVQIGSGPNGQEELFKSDIEVLGVF